jgi:NAD(P)-dependent dehydrogenase (short-subunit alcohol dehydrogenase family)
VNKTATHQDDALWQAPGADLTGKRVVVVGASGGVGEEITRELLAARATVMGTGRDATRLAALAQRMDDAELPGTFTPVALDALDPALDEELARLSAAHGPFDGIVLAVGTWGRPGQGGKPLVQHTDEEWDDLITGNLTSIFRLIRGFVPLLPANGVLVQVNGLSADVPYPTNGAVGATSAGTKSLMTTAAVELGGAGPRLVELILGVVRTRINPDNTLEGYSWLNGSQAGQHVAALLAGTSGLDDAVVQYFVDRYQGPFPARSPF